MITTIKDIRLPRLNNAEYTSFLGSVETLITKATPTKLGVQDALFTAYKENILALTEVMKHTRASKETQNLEALDRERDELLSFLFTSIKNDRKNPNASRKEAAKQLYLVVKPYFGVQNSAHRQETQYIESLQTDLSRAENSAHITSLGLQDAVNTLVEKNTAYKTLTSDRADAIATTTPLQNAKQIRQKTDEQYKEITLRAFAQSVAQPNDEATAFITSINKLIDDTNTAYKQRSATAKKNTP